MIQQNKSVTRNKGSLQAASRQAKLSLDMETAEHRVWGSSSIMAGQLTCIDLFCGCGGFSLGMQRAGFRVLAAIDVDPQATAVYRANFAGQRHVQHLLTQDLTIYEPEQLAAVLGTTHVDVIVGGPPCQGFSMARQRDGANSGDRLIADPRRDLYQRFLAFVAFFKPAVFVMENVLGIRTAQGGKYFRRVQAEARQLQYRVHAQVELAAELGVPQKRRRQLFFGTREVLPILPAGCLRRVSRAPAEPTLGMAIDDLPPLAAGQGEAECGYDMQLRAAAVAQHGRAYLFDVLEVGQAKNLTSHVARYHSDRDLRDFRQLHEGESSAAAMRRGVPFEHTYDKTVFKDRYTRQSRVGLCSTIVAHMNRDGLMFIHPTQDRSLTPREAARVQSFPDWFLLPVAQTHQYRLIGNAVPPLVAEAIGTAVVSYLQMAAILARASRRVSSSVPEDVAQAEERLLVLAKAWQGGTLASVPLADFRHGWFALAYLFPHLHPHGALDSGEEVCHTNNAVPPGRHIARWLVQRCYVQNGWPIGLVPIAIEADRRVKAGELAPDEFYCNEAVVAGARKGNLAHTGALHKKPELLVPA